MNSADASPSLDFQSLDLKAELTSSVASLGFSQMTPIQVEAIPILLQGRDLIGQSQTGSGKTLAFALPLLQKLNLANRQVQAVVICPTRELATQVISDMRKLGRELSGLQVLSVTGGQPGRLQANSLELGVHVVVGTPGRLLDHLERERMDLSQVQMVVLDEADKMLEMGFELELNGIMAHLPPQRQTVLFSATFPESIQTLSRHYQNKPQRVTITASEKTELSIQQILYPTTNDEKVNTLMRVLQQHPSDTAMIFCNQKATVAEVGELLTRYKVSAAVLHGDLEQKERDRVMAMFRNGSYRILVATDVAARGLDIENLQLVVNLDLPAEPQVYVHRIGRTGRAGRSGLAVTLMKPNEDIKVHAIEQLTGVKLERKVLGFKNQHGLSGSYLLAPMQTLSIAGGRKDKLRPGDILGALTATTEGSSQALKAENIGKIEIHDHFSYVAVASPIAALALGKLREGRIKGKKYQVKLLK